MKAYNYAFYRYYVASRFSGQKTIPHVTATFQLSMVDMFMAATIGYLVVPRLAAQVFSAQHWLSAAFLVAVFYFPNHFLFLTGDKYREVVKAFERESKRAKVVGSILAVAVLFGLIFSAVWAQSLATH